jgi:hypothetical protein
MTEEEKRNILATARANIAGERVYIPESVRIERRMQQREHTKVLEQVASECERAYFAWADEADDEAAGEALTTKSAQTMSWAQWVDSRLEQEREFILEAVGNAIGEFAAEERLKIRGELLSEINRLRAEAARERNEDIRELKIRNAELNETLPKMREEVSGKQADLPARMTH